MVIIVFAIAMSLWSSAASTPAADLLASGKADEAIAVLQKPWRIPQPMRRRYNLLCRAYYSVRQLGPGYFRVRKIRGARVEQQHVSLVAGTRLRRKSRQLQRVQCCCLAKKARVEFETAVQLNPENVEARGDLSEFYVEAPGMMGGGTDKAEAQAQALEKLFPARAHWIRARIAEKKKDYPTAEKEYRAAIQTSRQLRDVAGSGFLFPSS